ncbi:tryptophan-rich sensory protein [Exiguobacterium flavidum]|uniref:tryptophan-rich sensory protein n=1 Tax=Exiguobacterium flavidum TaxID=2184695 RepID=UPI001E39588A|nr:tryptophan-rich sensory protein [Exiguobacterium flavidum]
MTSITAKKERSVSKSWVWLNWAGFVIMVTANILDGGRTGRISDTIDTLFKPAGYVFSIWGLIYALLLVWLILQTIPKFKENEISRKIGPWFFVSCLANGAWLAMFSMKWFPASLIVMFVLLLSLVVIYWKIDSTTKNLRFKAPFSIYIGWVSVATIANVFLLMETSGNDVLLGFGDAEWTMIMLGVGVALALLFMLGNNDPIYPLVFVWAYIGINAASDNGLVSTVALVSVIVLIAGYLLLLLRLRKKQTA